jgi:hypothetical protein
MREATVLRVAAGACGVVGPIVLVASFAINPAPPPGLGVVALAAWAAQHHGLMLFGEWMQGAGSALIVVFSLALADLSGPAGGFWRRLTILASQTILAVSLMEVCFYLAAAQAAASGDVSLGLVTAGLIKAVQHVFLIAPAVLLPMSVMILRSRLLPTMFGWTGLTVGGGLQGLGLAGLFAHLQSVVDGVLIVQSAWFVVAGLWLAVTKAAVVAAPLDPLSSA